jgi:chemotaxis protein MotB
LPDSQWRSNHQLAAAQAMAVFEQLASSHQFAARQMFVLGHGPNYPIAANTSAEGQRRNRRVEVVIYPETIN